MKIALDWDGTFTSDPTLWSNFVAMAKQRGHDVKIVTARMSNGNNEAGYNNDDLELTSVELGVEVVYTNMQQKQDAYGADIWIDDRPDMVLGSAQILHMADNLNRV